MTGASFGYWVHQELYKYLETEGPVDQLPADRFEYAVTSVVGPVSCFCLEPHLQKTKIFTQNHHWKDQWESTFMCCNRCIFDRVPIIRDARFSNQRDSIRSIVMETLQPPIHRFPNAHGLSARKEFIESTTNMLVAIANLILPLSKMIAEFVFDHIHWNLRDESKGYQIFVRDFLTPIPKQSTRTFDVFPSTTVLEVLKMFLEQIGYQHIPVSHLKVRYSTYIHNINMSLSEYEIHPESSISVLLC